MANTVYKVMRADEWAETMKSGVFIGSADDKRDGFIHFSTAAQISGTLQKHYAGIEGLVLLAIDPGQFGVSLKWEPSRGGALFPHLYAPLPFAAVKQFAPIPLGKDGQHHLPADMLHD